MQKSAPRHSAPRPKMNNKKQRLPVRLSTKKSFSTAPTSPTDTAPQQPTAKELRTAARKNKASKTGPTEAELTAAVDAPTTHHSYAINHTVYSNTRAQDFTDHQSKYTDFTPYHDAIKETMSVDQFLTKYQSIENGARLREDKGIILNARIHNKRTASNKLSFLDVSTQFGTALQKKSVQVMCSAFNMNEESLDLSKIVKKGDWVSITGFPGKSDTGELSLIATDAQLLSPCLQYPPNALVDPNIRFRNRHLDLMVNRDSVMEIFRVRTGIISELRKYLNNIDFVEVETPILWTQSGGATARPFLTSSNAFGTDLPLTMRIAPELFLKQLVIGGMERVFEIGRVFRNEGIDATHNPEFTSCELYQAHADYNTMMDFTEDLLRTIVRNLTGGTTLRVMPHGINSIDTPAEYHRLMGVTEGLTHEAAFDQFGVKIIDFAQPFKKLDVIETLRREAGIELPDNYNDDEALPALRDICHKRGWVLKPPFTIARCLDTMISEVIEPMCIQPTFIMNHPIALSPLAKRSSSNPQLTERFELFINTKEYANAYSELNIPTEQLDRFTSQHKLKDKIAQTGGTGVDDKDFIDDEAHPVDTPYCESLQYGLPPTAGWGLGIDRLVMLCSQQHNIRDVVLFPIMKPETGNKPDPKPTNTL